MKITRPKNFLEQFLFQIGNAVIFSSWDDLFALELLIKAAKICEFRSRFKNLKMVWILALRSFLRVENLRIYKNFPRFDGLKVPKTFIFANAWSKTRKRFSQDAISNKFWKFPRRVWCDNYEETFVLEENSYFRHFNFKVCSLKI